MCLPHAFTHLADTCRSATSCTYTHPHHVLARHLPPTVCHTTDFPVLFRTHYMMPHTLHGWLAGWLTDRITDSSQTDRLTTDPWLTGLAAGGGGEEEGREERRRKKSLVLIPALQPSHAECSKQAKQACSACSVSDDVIIHSGQWEKEENLSDVSLVTLL